MQGVTYPWAEMNKNSWQAAQMVLQSKASLLKRPRKRR